MLSPSLVKFRYENRTLQVWLYYVYRNLNQELVQGRGRHILLLYVYTLMIFQRSLVVWGLQDSYLTHFEDQKRMECFTLLNVICRQGFKRAMDSVLWICKYLGSRNEVFLFDGIDG